MIKQKNHVVDLLFSLALFCVFAASALTIVIMGADVYQKSVNDMNRNSTIRTSLSYLSEKIHQNDAENAIRIDQLNDLPSCLLYTSLVVPQERRMLSPRTELSSKVKKVPIPGPKNPSYIQMCIRDRNRRLLKKPLPKKQKKKPLKKPLPRNRILKNMY